MGPALPHRPDQWKSAGSLWLWLSSFVSQMTRSVGEPTRSTGPGGCAAQAKSRSIRRLPALGLTPVLGEGQRGGCRDGRSRIVEHLRQSPHQIRSETEHREAGAADHGPIGLVEA